MSDQGWQEWFEEAWRIREEVVYRSLFGDIGPGIYPLDQELFSSQFKQNSIDPRWLSHGVFECPPTDGRESWLYVSSGLSNAWEAKSPNPTDESGLGCEFIFECPEQSLWALRLLRSMVAFHILLSVDRFPGKPLLKVWDRIPLRAPIDGEGSALTWLLLTPSPKFSGTQRLPSGVFEFIHFLGISEDEAEFARSNGSDNLFERLIAANAAPVTNPRRPSVLS